MPTASCTRHTALSNNCSSPVRSDKFGTVHTVNQKQTHSWTWQERNLMSLKQSFKTPRVVNIHTKYVNLRTPLRRERRVLFAELSSRGGRSTPTHCRFPLLSTHTASLMLFEQALVRDLWMWSTLAARRDLCLSHLCALSIRRSS